jgi:hypothetical protein
MNACLAAVGLSPQALPHREQLKELGMSKVQIRFSYSGEDHFRRGGSMQITCPTTPEKPGLLMVISVGFVGGDYVLDFARYVAEGENKPSVTANFIFRNTMNGGGTLRYAFLAMEYWLNAINTMSEEKPSTLRSALAPPNLPLVCMPIDQGSGWLGLGTNAEGNWLMVFIPWDVKTSLTSLPIPSHWGDLDVDAASAMVVLPFLPRPISYSLLQLYRALHRDATSPRFGGDFA